MNEQTLHDTAAAWFVRLRADDSGAADREAFARWLTADTAHRLAYAEVAAAAFACEQLAPAVQTADVAPRWVRPRPRALRWVGAFAAVLVLGLLWLQGARWNADLRADWVTAAGEVRELTLDDGSRAWLAPDSALAFDADDARRDLHLLRGEVFVTVTSDPDRPFRVHGGAVVARAVGTRYAVERLGAMVQVAVEEGRVAVETGAGEAPVTLGAGQQLRWDGVTLGATRAVERVAAWRDRLLVFEQLPLEAALARLERELGRRIVLLDGDAGRTPVTAAIPADAAAQGLALLAEQQGLRMHALPGLVVLAR